MRVLDPESSSRDGMSGERLAMAKRTSKSVSFPLAASRAQTGRVGAAGFVWRTEEQMKQWMALGLVGGALACGSGSESTAPVSAGAPPDARQLVEEEPGTWTEKAAPAGSPAQAGEAASGGSPGGGEAHPSVASCLDLVKASRWAEAVAPCTEAVRNAPGNREVASALERARKEAAAEATARATAAAQDATGAASDALEDTSSSLQEKGVESLEEKGVGSFPKGLQ